MIPVALYFKYLIIVAGQPATITLSGTSLSTNEPKPTMTLLPTVTPPRIHAFA